MPATNSSNGGGTPAQRTASFALFFELCDYLNIPRPEQAVQTAASITTSSSARSSSGARRAHAYGVHRPAQAWLLRLRDQAGQRSSRPALLFGCRTAAERRCAEQRLGAGNAPRPQSGGAICQGAPRVRGWPPFLVIVDVGYSIELFADFSGTGKAYVPFPDSLSHRFSLDQLEFQVNHDHLRAIWLDPFSLDPSRISARVTCDVACTWRVSPGRWSRISRQKRLHLF